MKSAAICSRSGAEYIIAAVPKAARLEQRGIHSHSPTKKNVGYSAVFCKLFSGRECRRRPFSSRAFFAFAVNFSEICPPRAI
jgi:hypothetical protein